MSLFFLNLAIRFCLEMTSLVGVGMWAWRLSDNWTRWLWAIGLPMLLSIIWGVFNVPDDPSRSGAAPVVVPGFVRLLIEAGFFAFGAYAWLSMGYNTLGGTFVVLVVLHYLVSFRRIAWLLKL